ncbi:MAG: hypothetical protein IT204_17320 [Fimbriimonadaceae bacterium]|nr:hypothetical protein [Fimbriimonadaceae bacterium]
MGQSTSEPQRLVLLPVELESPFGAVTAMLDRLAAEAWPDGATKSTAQSRDDCQQRRQQLLAAHAQSGRPGGRGGGAAERLESERRHRASWGGLGIPRSTTISILGGRGSGKSTLLAAVASHANEVRGDLVLPTVFPERLASTDQVLGCLVEYLEPARESASKHLRECWEELSEDWPVYLGDFGKALRRRGLTGLEYAEEVHQIAEIRRRCHQNLFGLVDGLLREWSCTDDQRPLLLLPIDDADLVPKRLPSLFREIRCCAVHPAIVPLVCASADSLWTAVCQTALPHSRKEAIKWATKRHLLQREEVTDGIRRQMDKAFPNHLLVQLSEWPVRDRLRFKPSADESSLVDLLRRFDLGARDNGPRTLGDLFDIGPLLLHLIPDAGDRTGQTPPLDPTWYAEILPPTPRELWQVYRQLQRLADDPALDARGKTGEAIRCLIDCRLRLANLELPSDHREHLRWTQRQDGLGVEIDWRNLTARSRYGSPVLLGRSRTVGTEQVQTRVRLRLGVTFRPDSDLVAVGGGPAEPGTMPAWLPQAMALIGEAVRRWEVIGCDLESGLPLAWSEWRPVLVSGLPLQLPNEDPGASDESHLGAPWHLPRTNGATDCEVYRRYWNHWRHELTKLDPGVREDDDALEWLLLSHLELVAAVQRLHLSVPGDDSPRAALPALPQDLDANLRNWQAQGRGEALERVKTALQEVGERLQEEPRELADYVEWLVVAIPELAQPKWCPATTIRQQIIELWIIALAAAGQDVRLAYQRRCEYSNYLRSALQRRPPSRHAALDLASLDELDSQLAEPFANLGLAGSPSSSSAATGSDPAEPSGADPLEQRAAEPAASVAREPGAADAVEPGGAAAPTSATDGEPVGPAVAGEMALNSMVADDLAASATLPFCEIADKLEAWLKAGCGVVELLVLALPLLEQIGCPEHLLGFVRLVRDFRKGDAYRVCQEVLNLIIKWLRQQRGTTEQTPQEEAPLATPDQPADRRGLASAASSLADPDASVAPELAAVPPAATADDAAEPSAPEAVEPDASALAEPVAEDVVEPGNSAAAPAATLDDGAEAAAVDPDEPDSSTPEPFVNDDLEADEPPIDSSDQPDPAAGDREP